MDERVLEETLGFLIEGSRLMTGGQFRRAATLAEVAMWQLLLTPQSQWDQYEVQAMQGGTR